MIISRTPFRISFAGGGSDLQAFWSQEPGMVLSCAVNRYMYLTVKHRKEAVIFGNAFRVSYSQTELRDRVDDVEHPIVRECLRCLRVERGLEIVSIADLPAQSGMGSSSTFTVGLLAALHALLGHVVSADHLARQACEIEIERLGEPIGKQDQYIAAHGGIQFIQFLPDGNVLVDPVICPGATKRELNRRLMLFFTGWTRQARNVLTRQKANTEVNMDALRHLCDIARRMREVLTAGRDLNVFGHLLQEAWRAKKSLEQTITNPHIDQWYEAGLEAGALGGKLLGAGGGGFLLFFCEPHKQDRLRAALPGLTEVPFGFEPQGAKLIYVGEEHW
jgi:D-glycero-alpha-D-manno-heptose-7-phosphate kinase